MRFEADMAELFAQSLIDRHSGRVGIGPTAMGQIGILAGFGASRLE